MNTSPSKPIMYRIIFRTCDKVNSLHNVPRPFGLSKREVIEVCFRSLVVSVQNYPHSIHIIADNISDELRQFFQSYNVVITEGIFGNDESIRVSLKQAMSYGDNDWVYICEDDYLHQPQTFLWIDDLIHHRKDILFTKALRGIQRIIPFNHRTRLHTMPLFIHPPDYPDRYKPRERRRSYLFISNYCHWRQISNTTFTFLAEVKTLKQYQSVLEHSASGANDGYLSQQLFARNSFRGKALCLSPIPGLTTHMHDGVMTPLVDWEKIIHQLQTDSTLPN